MRRSIPRLFHFRYWVLALLLTAAFLNYFDRQTLSVLKATIKQDFKIDDSGYALLVNAFTACYALAYLASGWLVDRFGPGRMLAAFIGVWSLATVGCGWARSFWQMAFCRGVLGLAEPGLHPTTLRSGTEWAPPGRRGLFISLCGLGSSIGTVAAPPLIAWLTVHFHWRIVFVVPGVVGLGVALMWALTYRDPKPDDGGEIAVAQGQPQDALTWAQLWKTPGLWGIVLCRLVSDPVWYFCLFWMPGYLQEARGVSLQQLGYIGWIPFAMANIGGISFACVSDWLANNHASRLRGRKKLLYITSFAGPITMLIALQPSLPATIILFCVMALICSSWLYTTSLVITEAFPFGNIASVWGISGAFGATGAIVFNYIIGQIGKGGDSSFLFLIMGGLHLVAAGLLWLLVKNPAGKPIKPL